MANETQPANERPELAADGELGRLGHYRVLGLVGKGGMGQVFRAEDMRLKRQVALKVMNKRFAAMPHGRKRFLDEARAVAAIHHDHVVTIFEVGETAGVPFMAMELLVGETLEARLEEGRPQPIGWTLELAAQLADGLAAAHRRGIIHRDIKPGNIWIEQPSGRIKLLDFGLALASTPVDIAAGRGSVMGTPGYLSPEQACGEPLDDRSDLFSVGVVLYRLVCGRMPFPATTVSEQLIKIIAHQPPRPETLEPSVPPPVADLIMRLLAKEPRDRFRSTAVLRAEIGRAVQELAQRAEAEAPIVVAAPPGKSASRRSQGNTVEVPKTRRRGGSRWAKDKRIWGVAAAGAALLLAAVIVALPSSEPAGRRSTDTAGQAVERESAGPVVLARSLDVLSIVDIPAATSEVLAGEQARFQLTFSNTARSPEQDPRVINRESRVIAQVAISLRPSGEPTAASRTPGFPKKLSAAMLPAPGESKVIDVEFLSSAVPPGSYEVVFELQSPHGTRVDRTETSMVVGENLATADLLAFDKVRTQASGGADAFVVSGSDQEFGGRPYVEVERPAKSDQEQRLKHAYLRFDLGEWGERKTQLDRGLLLLTLEPGGLKGKATIAAYGVSEQVGQKWAEKGDGHLIWEKSPSAGDVESYPFLGRVEIDNRGGALENRRDEVRLFGRGLDDYLRSVEGNRVTILLVRTSSGDQPTRFVSREGQAENSPALALRAVR